MSSAGTQLRSPQFHRDGAVIKLVGKEFRDFGSFLGRNFTPVTVIGTALLFFSLKEYHPLSPYWVFRSFITGFASPVIVLLIRKTPLISAEGGNWRTWLLHVVIFVLIGLPVLYIASRFTSLDDYYTAENLACSGFPGNNRLHGGVGILLPGFPAFRAEGKIRRTQHFHSADSFCACPPAQAEIETLSTIVTGIYFGYVAWRGNSFWPALIIHLFINIVFRVMVNYW